MKISFFRTESGNIKFDSVSRRNKYKECERKAAYSNIAANIAIKKFYKTNERLLRTYLCPHCKMWHLTHTK